MNSKAIQHLQATEHLQVFDKNEIFSTLSLEQQSELYELFTWVGLIDSQEIIHEGDVADFLVLVASGAVEVSRMKGDKRQMVGLAKAGSVLGEMGIISHEPRFATCRSINESVVGILTRDRFDGLRTSNVGLYTDLLQVLGFNLCRRLRQTTELVGRLKANNEIAVTAATKILEATMAF